jgi:glycosyltransferase involved in cell wall biosynthesis
MRIGILPLALGRQAGGPETYEAELIRGLAKIDPENEYFVYCPEPRAADALGPLPANFSLRILRPALRAVSLAFTLPRSMAADRIDLFHATYAPPPLPNKPFVFTMHCASNFAHPEYYPTWIRWRLNALQRAGLRRARTILCVSDFVARYLRDQFRVPPGRLVTVYNGVAPEFFAASAAAGPFDFPYVLYAGKLQARKNVVGLIHAFARYRELTGSEARLVLAGKRVETSEGIDEAIAAHNLASHVVELGYVSDRASLLPRLYAGARMLVFPSLYEGFGIPVAEAMAAGCPVVASNVTSLPEIAGDAALLVDPSSIDAIAEAMARLDRDTALRAGLIERGRLRAARFTWESTARQTLAAYRKAASQG